MGGKKAVGASMRVCARSRIHALITYLFIVLTYFPNDFNERCPKMSPIVIDGRPFDKKLHIKADLRREITPWRALCWAYADECVGVATNVPDDHHLFISNGLMQTTYGERMARGSINGALDAHEDAFTIDGFLYRACGGREGLKPYHRLREAAELRKPVPATIEVPAIQCVPRLDSKGRIDLVLPLRETHRDRAIACLVSYEGFPADKAEALHRAHAAFYDLFHNVLACMQDLKLVKWRVTPS